MSSPPVILILLHVVILLTGSAVLWTIDRWPRTILIVSGFTVAGGGWAMWFAGDTIGACGLEAGEFLLRFGQWTVALGIAVWCLVAVVRRDPSVPASLVGWTDWVKALFAYWFLCFVIALVEGVVIFIGTTPHTEFR